MRKNCDKVLTIDDFDEEYSSWKGRSITIMGEKMKVAQNGLQPRYFDTIYLFEEIGLLVGFDYDQPIPLCYITTMDGLESDPLADVAPFLFFDNNKYYAVVKKQYRNVDLKRHVIGLNILEIPSLNPLYSKMTWPIWESIESIEQNAIVVKKADCNYAISTIKTFPATYVVNMAYYIEYVDGYEYKVKSSFDSHPEIVNLEKKINKAYGCFGRKK